MTRNVAAPELRAGLAIGRAGEYNLEDESRFLIMALFRIAQSRMI